MRDLKKSIATVVSPEANPIIKKPSPMRWKHARPIADAKNAQQAHFLVAQMVSLALP